MVASWSMMVAAQLLLMNHFLVSLSHNSASVPIFNINSIEVDIGCPYGCIECSAINGCLACKPPFYLLLRREGPRQKAHCTRVCPKGFYKVTKKRNGFCAKCTMLGCAECDRHHYCSKCNFNYMNFFGKCIPNQPENSLETPYTTLYSPATILQGSVTPAPPGESRPPRPMAGSPRTSTPPVATTIELSETRRRPQEKKSCRRKTHRKEKSEKNGRRRNGKGRKKGRQGRDKKGPKGRRRGCRRRAKDRDRNATKMERGSAGPRRKGSSKSRRPDPLEEQSLERNATRSKVALQSTASELSLKNGNHPIRHQGRRKPPDREDSSREVNKTHADTRKKPIVLMERVRFLERQEGKRENRGESDGRHLLRAGDEQHRWQTLMSITRDHPEPLRSSEYHERPGFSVRHRRRHRAGTRRHSPAERRANI